MNKSTINFQDIETAAQNDIQGLVTKWLPDGKLQGSEWIVLNPTRSDKTLGSFKINLDTGAWSDFASGDNGNNVTGLYHYISGYANYRDSMIALGNELATGVNEIDNTPKPTTKPKRVYSTPPEKVWINPNIGEITPSKTYHYQNSQGENVLVVYRCDKSDKLPKKEFRQLSRVDGGWSWISLKQNPLYRLLDISLLSNLPVILCEGEKAADAAQQIFKDKVVTTTTAGGSKAVHKTDFSPLQNRDVYIWPDKDKAGQQYAIKVANLAQAFNAKSVHILSTPEKWSEKWDAADVLALGKIPKSVLDFSTWKSFYDKTNATKEVNENTEEKDFCEFCGIKTPFRFFEKKSKAQEVQEEMLPSNIRGWITDVSKRMQTHPTFSAAAAISFISSIIARRINITPKRYDKQWTVYPNVWGAIVGKAGSQKSPSITPMFEPIRKHNKKMLDLHKIELENWEYEIEDCKKNKTPISEYPEKPTREGLFTNDATPEALQKIHQENPQGVLLYRDELSGFIDQMTKQGREGARQFFLEGWSGDGAFSYDTISRGNTYIDGLCLTLFGSIQPSILAKQVENDRNGTGADGFIQRFQLLVKSNPIPNYILSDSDVEPDYQSKQLYEDVFERLLNLPANNKPITVNFNERAQDIFDVWYEALENRLRAQKMPDMLASHLSKYRSLMPSLALIFEAINNGSFCVDVLNKYFTVSEESTLLALEWVKYLELVADDILIEDNEGQIDHSIVLSEKIASKIASGNIKDGATIRDFKSKFRGKNDKIALPHALEMLHENGWIEIKSIQPLGGGRPKECIFINPALLQKKEIGFCNALGEKRDTIKGHVFKGDAEFCDNRGKNHVTLNVVDSKQEKEFCDFCDTNAPLDIKKEEKNTSQKKPSQETPKCVTKVAKLNEKVNNSICNNTLHNNTCNNIHVTKLDSCVTKHGNTLSQNSRTVLQNKNGTLSVDGQIKLDDLLSKVEAMDRYEIRHEFMSRHAKGKEGAWAWIEDRCEVDN